MMRRQSTSPAVRTVTTVPNSSLSARSEARTEPAVIGPTSEAVSDNYPAGGLELPGPQQSRQGLLRERMTQRYAVAEAAAVRTRAAALGVKPSAWVRAVVLDALDSRRDEVGRLHRVAARKPDPQVAAAVEQVRRVGVLLNQELRHRNKEKTTDPVSDELIEDALFVVDDLRIALGDRTKQ